MPPQGPDAQEGARRRYFSYGPDILTSRLQERVGGPVNKVACRAATLPGYELRFVPAPSGEPGARATVQLIGGGGVDLQEEGVDGVVYELTEAQLRRLDALEGVPRVTMDIRVTAAGPAPATMRLPCEVFVVAGAPLSVSAAQQQLGPGAGPSDEELDCLLQGARAEGLSYDRFWRTLPLASGRRGGYCLAYDKDMAREVMDQMAGGRVAWVGPARVNGWRLRPEAGAGEGAPLEGVLYLLTEEQLMTLEDCADGRERALVGVTLAGADGTPGACIEEDVLLYARPADVGARAVALPPHEVGQVAYSARRAGLSPAYMTYLEGLVASSPAAAAAAAAAAQAHHAGRVFLNI